MSTIEATRLLAQMRSMALEAGVSPMGAGGATGLARSGAVGSPLGAGQVVGKSGGAENLDFGAVMRGALDRVNAMQQNAQGLATAFEQGVPGVDIAKVMIEVQKAGLAFRATTEVRNRLVNAYQEVMNMPL